MASQFQPEGNEGITKQVNLDAMYEGVRFIAEIQAVSLGGETPGIVTDEDARMFVETLHTIVPGGINTRANVEKGLMQIGRAPDFDDDGYTPKIHPDVTRMQHILDGAQSLMRTLMKAGNAPDADREISGDETVEFISRLTTFTGNRGAEEIYKGLTNIGIASYLDDDDIVQAA